MASKFPDLTGDGKVTQADVLKGRGVESMKKGGLTKKYAEGGVLEEMKDIFVQGAKKVGEDIQRIAGTERGKELDKEADAEMRKRAANAGMKAAAQDLKRERVRAEAGRYKKGGAVKSASSRADGIAQRGKTRGMMK